MWRRLSAAVLSAGVLAAALLSLQGPTLAQTTEDSKGTNFWLMFNSNLGSPTLSLFITGDVATNGNVAIPGLGVNLPFAVVPGTVTTVPIPVGAVVGTADGIENKGINVTAAQEVTVYGLNRIQATTDAYLGLPTDILGTDYIVLGYSNTSIHSSAGTQFGVVASQNATTVTITPSETTGARVAGVPYNVVLNQGQAYQLRNPGFGPTFDLSGTIITSDKPIAVFGSNLCTNIPAAGFSACDHIVEQLPPTTTWGRSFGTVPLATRLNGDTFRIMASTDDTAVSINGAVVATLDRGQHHEQIVIGRSSITADKPVLVAQYSNSSTFDNVTSDPFMMLLPPLEQFLAGYTITTPAAGFASNFANVVAPSATVGAVTMDGVPIPPGSFAPIPGTSFSGASVPISLGSHQFAGPQPFGLFVYGYASFDSYGYPGGLALGQVASVTNLDLTPATATNPVNTEHCVTALVTDQNDQPLSGVRVDFTVAGTHTTSGFAFTNAAGQAQFCYTGTIAGGDTITAAVGALTDTATKTWTAVNGVVCDADGDQDVDVDDLSLIRQANGVLAGPGDPRDGNGDGRINVADVRYCSLRCTRASCAR